MRTFAFGRYAVSLGAAAALLAGCGGSQPPIGALGSTDGARTNSAIRSRERSLAKFIARNLLYVAASSVQVFTYPRGKRVGSLGVFDDYLCSDGFGNVFVTGAEGISYVWVFPHGGGAPIATLYNPQNPGGCSVEKNTGNVAVADPDSSPIVIFPYKVNRGWRLARQYKDTNMRASLYCTYDPEGNLFIDGYSASGSFILVKLPKGSSTFTTITLDKVIHSPGSVQWDDWDLAVEDAGTSRSSAAVIYRFAISGSHGHKVSATTLRDSEGGAQFLIHRRIVIGPLSSSSGEGIGFWSFPSGGAPFSTVSTYGYGHPSGEALSLK